jgi:hypothetical protein
MAFYLSPLVKVREVDLSTTIPSVATAMAAIALRNTYKGPERKKYFITNESALVETFGFPTSASSCYRDLLSAMGYLNICWYHSIKCIRRYFRINRYCILDFIWCFRINTFSLLLR